MIAFARVKRANGWSIHSIVRELNERFGHGSTGQTLKHVRDVKILAEAVPFWQSQRGGSAQRALIRWTDAQERADAIITDISSRDMLIAMMSLYWAEGTRRAFELTNSDPHIIFIFVETIRRIFGVQNDDIGVVVRVFEDLDHDSCRSFWLRVLKLPDDHHVSYEIRSGKRRGKLRFGMCRVRVRKSGQLLKTVRCLRYTFSALLDAPVAQWIEQRVPNLPTHVRIVAGAYE